MKQATSTESTFQGNERFEVLERLGAGAFGVVYRARDKVRNLDVALKTMQRVDPQNIYLFKQEFRSLTGLSHPNLAQFYDLVSEGETWFFTMELVEGTDFLSFVRGDPRLSGQPAASQSLAGSRRPRGLDAEGLGRLKSALCGLVTGVRALHKHNMLHRDLKPDNVIVTPDGRVVLLDFGLVYRLEDGGAAPIAGGLVGTPLYMSPEQAAEDDVGEASDWYSVGVMLYQALTGQPPISGSMLRLLAAKQKPASYAPSAVVPGVPPVIDQLCRGLLATEPADRPAGSAIARVLGLGDEPAATPARRSFFGRGDELDVLDQAYRRMREGRSVFLCVKGPAGIGKSELLRRFLSEVPERDQAVVLHGRCYQHESVPFKAWDSLIDELCQVLLRLPAHELRGYLPRNLAALCRLFPVFLRVDEIAAALSERTALAIKDAVEIQRRAFLAFKDLLGRLSERQALVLFIDDLHWGDRDSALLMSELLSPPECPRALLLGSYRSEEVARSPFLSAIKERDQLGQGDPLELITLDALSEADAAELARSLLGEGDARAAPLAAESHGNPFLLTQLARSLSADDEVESLSLNELIARQISGLLPERRRFVECVSLINRPLPLRTALEIAEVEGITAADLRALAADHLIATRVAGGRQLVEPSQDRVAACIVAELSEGQRQLIHERAAAALAADERVDPVLLAYHTREAGDLERSSDYLRQAADQAFEALAFDKAARIWREALDQGGLLKAERVAIQARLGDALAYTGHARAAAEAYLEASKLAEPERRLELQRKVAHQLNACGQYALGRQTLEGLVEIPRGSWLDQTRLLVRHLRLGFRWRSFQKREPDAGLRQGLENLWVSILGTAAVDPIACYHQALKLFERAQALGDARYYALSLLLQTWFLNCADKRESADAFRQRAHELLTELDEPYLEAFAHFVTSIHNYYGGRYLAALEFNQAARTIFLERCPESTWELNNLRLFQVFVTHFLGDIKGLRQLGLKLSKYAQERGDLYLELVAFLRARHPVMLIEERTDEAAETLARLTERWRAAAADQRVMYVELWLAQARWNQSLYLQDGRAAWKDVNASWRGLRLIHSLHYHERLISTLIRARSALAAALESSGAAQRSLLGAARQAGRKVCHPHFHDGRAFQCLIEASALSIAGERRGAAAALRFAEDGFRAHHMELLTRLARRCQGLLRDDEPGRELVAESESYLAEIGARDPQRLTALHLPGRWRP